MKNAFDNPPKNVASTRDARFGVRRSSARASTRSRGFTLLEVLVTLALMAIMLAIVFVPLNSAFNIFQIGNSRNDLQLATRQTTSQLESDLRKAVYVFPNSEMPGITDKAPYNNNPPYIAGTCASGTRVSNTSRVDILVPLRNNEVYPTPAPRPDGSVVNPVRPAYYLVTYYVRRADPSKAFDAITNPLQLFRAQMPYKNSNGNDFEVSASKKNIEVTGARYTANADCDDTSRWLRQDASNNEPLDLEYNDPSKLKGKTRDTDPLISTPIITGSHTLASPRDLSLPPMNEDLNNLDLRPRGTSFISEDTNGDGKIDRVTVNLTLVKYDTASVGGSAEGKPTYQQNAVTDVVNLVNVR